MYRLLSAKRLTESNLKFLTVRNCVINGDRPIFNSILGPPLNLTPAKTGANQQQIVRYQSFTPNAEALKVLKKRKKFKEKKWIELVQVTAASSKQTRTSVQNLRAKKLSDFIEKPQAGSNLGSTTFATNDIIRNRQPERTKPVSVEYEKVNLDMYEHSDIYDETPVLFLAKELSENTQKLPDAKEILESFHQFKTVTEHNEFTEHQFEEHEQFSQPATSAPPAELLEEEMEIIENDILRKPNEDLDVKTLKVIKNDKVKEQRFKSKQHKSAEHERLAKEKSLASNLTSYLDVCVANGMLNRGLTTLYMYRYKYKQVPTAIKIIDINLYNKLLHGCAEKGNFEKVKEILDILKEDNIQPNPQTFAAIFECLGRVEEDEENINSIQKYYKQAQSMNISLNMILDESKFLFDQREIVLDAIHRIKPDFEPKYSSPPLTYKNRLLTSLDQHVRPIHEEASTSNSIEGSQIMKPKSGFNSEELRELAREQLAIELNGSVTVQSIEHVKELKNAEFYRKKMKDLQTQWRAQISAAFQRDLNTLKVKHYFKSKRAMTYFAYLKCLDTGQFADVILEEIRMLAEGSETYSPTVGQLYRELGQKVQARYQIEMKKRNGILEKTGNIYSEYCENLIDLTGSDNPRQMWQRIVHKNQTYGPSMDVSETTWPSNVTAGVGRFLYNILMRDIKIDANIMRTNSKMQNLLPAFYTLFRNQGKFVKEEVKPHPVLSRLLRSSQQKTLTFAANSVPMLCPPQPWSTPVNGGYILTKSELIRLPHQAVQQWERIKHSNQAELYPSLDSLNQLASIPWRVNTEMLDVIIEVFNKGGDAKLDIARPPSALQPPEFPADMNSEKQNKFRWFRQKLVHRRKQAEMYSLWCDTLYRLSLANHYRDKVFWLPHNMDFRGRVYPVPPHLNHLGSDMARSMLIFNQAQPLGVDGFSWLKLHCINLTGLKKKESIRERLLYAEEVLDDIIDSADNPLTGRMWWAKSDEPWQTLACCMEIAKVARCPNPEKYMSRFPIHQDGSCNGLQHYAALGRDKAGAISVNLTPSEVPQDVYSAVATLVESTRQKDAENGVQIAKILDGYVRRKVIKQTVMTTVYGVTRYGARLQIARQLKDIEEFPKEWVWPASTYLTTKTFESLREMFTSTKEIQDWFTECARLIASVCGENVEWVTPLGLPVVQPYNRTDSRALTKNWNKVDENMPMDMFEKPNILKQKNAFPPNFIHSLDSSHMMLTSLHCERKGVTFVSVHDCFWTHACTVPDMNKICREQFVALHSLPILEDLSKFLVHKYSYSEKLKADGSQLSLTKMKLNKLLRQVPAKGNFNLNDVLESVYFFC